MTRAWTMMTVVFISNTLRMLLMLCRWKKEDRQTLLTCASIVKCLSKMAPRLRADRDGVMLLSPIIISLMLERSPTVGVCNSNERVFSSFNFSQFIAIHSFISITQASIRLMVSRLLHHPGQTRCTTECRPCASERAVHAAAP